MRKKKNEPWNGLFLDNGKEIAKQLNFSEIKWDNVRTLTEEEQERAKEIYNVKNQHRTNTN